MRIIIILLLISFTVKPAFTQVPTKQEMQNQMAQAIKELNDQIAELEKQIVEAKKNKEDSESIKQMEDELSMLKKQVAMMGGLNKNVSKMSSKTIQQAVDQENSTGLPERDVARINALPKKPLADAELAVFVQKINTAIDNKISVSQKKNAKELYDEISLESKSADALGNIAVLCWMAGSTDMALWILGKACVKDMSNTDNLNNYASFLSMVGGEHLAIPILQNLQNKFPDNTTTLNNLGQAWYGLGEMNNAKKYLDGTMHFASAHPYANETISDIDESQGNKEESIESLKRSIKEEYTPEKEARLNKKGVKLKYDDIDDPECSKAAGTAGKAAQLGFEKFLSLIPDYPMEGGAGAETLHQQWYDFRDKLGAVEEKLNDEIKPLEEKAKAYAMSLKDNPNLLAPYNTRQYKTANRKLTLLIEWGTDRVVALANKMYAAGDSIEKWREDYNKAILALGKEPSCGAKLALASDFNMKANNLWHQRNNEWLNFQKEFLNSEARLFLCATTDRSVYEMNIAKIKAAFISYLGGLSCEFEVGCIKQEVSKSSGKILPDFDEMNCQYKTELSIPYAEKLFSIKVECNKMTTKFDVKYLKGSLEENLANGKYHGIVEVQQKIGSDKEQYGPIEIGTQVKVKGTVEFTEGGIQDVSVGAEVGVKAGPMSVSSLEGKMSVITGKGSITGKGAFSGISIK